MIEVNGWWEDQGFVISDQEIEINGQTFDLEDSDFAFLIGVHPIVPQVENVVIAENW